MQILATQRLYLHVRSLGAHATETPGILRTENKGRINGRLYVRLDPPGTDAPRPTAP